MNKNVAKAMEGAGRLKALLYSLENIAKDIDFKPEDLEEADKAANLLYLAQEVTEELTKTLDTVSADARICDVLILAREVHASSQG
ncbi:MAG: hypothetical protein LUC98_05100 [Lachnospiraceae bacterium]|nr:hypothetical protein [Lachnospiraceae bacterium]